MNELTNHPTDIAKTADVSFGASMQHLAAMTQLAEILANSSALPETLTHDKPKDKGGKLLPAETRKANAFLIVNQARQWDCDPMSLAQGTSIIYGKLMYEGKLISGIVNARAGLVAPLDYEFSGQGDQRTCRVFGRLARDPDVERSATVVLHKVRTKNQIWKDDPDQMLTYRGVRQWARRHTPSILMGVVEDGPEVRQAVAEQAEANVKTLDPVIIEDAHRERISNAINMDKVDQARNMVEADRDELGDVRADRLEQYADAKENEIPSPKFIEFVGRITACDFGDQKALDILLADLRKSSEDMLEHEVDELRSRFKLEVERTQNVETI